MTLACMVPNINSLGRLSRLIKLFYKNDFDNTPNPVEFANLV
jgi:hypothetical protein